jgi:hypothetical protein
MKYKIILLSVITIEDSYQEYLKEEEKLAKKQS